jgi:hypothetical protein
LHVKKLIDRNIKKLTKNLKIFHIQSVSKGQEIRNNIQVFYIAGNSLLENRRICDYGNDLPLSCVSSHQNIQGDVKSSVSYAAWDLVCRKLLKEQNVAEKNYLTSIEKQQNSVKIMIPYFPLYKLNSFRYFIKKRLRHIYCSLQQQNS